MGSIENIKYEILNESHVNGLCYLYRDVFNKEVDPIYFVEKYGLNQNINQFSVVAIQKEQVVGFFGAIFQRFVDDNQVLQMVSCGDYILVKRLRGKKIFDQIYNKLKEKAESENIDYMYAFQSDQTYKVAKKWGWKDEVGMKRVQINLFPFSTYKLVNKLGLSNYRVAKLKQELTPFMINKFDVDFREKGMFVHVYDDQFFKLKSFANHYWIKIAGCNIALKYDYRITVGFIQFTSKANVSKMFSILKKVARKSLIHEIVFHVQENTSESKQLAQFMPLKKSFQVSSIKLNEQAPSFSEVKLNFLDMDIF